MKILNICFVLLILGGVFERSHGTNLNCQFSVGRYFSENHYTCEVSSLDNTNNDIVITGYSGSHIANKTNADVKGINIQDTNTKYIPRNLGSLSSLTALRVLRTQLVEIKTQDFHGMQNLQYLDLDGNKLTSIPIDTFSTLTKLKIIELSSNLIKEIPNGVFSNNLQLEFIYLSYNKIKFLGSTLFDGLTQLDYVDLRENICNNKIYRNSTAIIQLKIHIQSQCKNPKEVTTTENPTNGLTTMTTGSPVDASTTNL